jgi:hypothetical protein
VNSSVTHHITWTNTGSQPVGVRFSVTHASAEWRLHGVACDEGVDMAAVAPGQSCDLDLSFSPTALGFQSPDLWANLYTTGSNATPIGMDWLNITGVSRFLGVSRSVDFGDQRSGRGRRGRSSSRRACA